MKRIVIDLDNTIAGPKTHDYSDCPPNQDVIARLRAYKKEGFEVCVHTSRNMRTHNNSAGKITAHTVPTIIEWLNAHEVPYDEIWIGKPWCGADGFYVDDRAIRPDEFVALSLDQVYELIGTSDAGNEQP